MDRPGLFTWIPAARLWPSVGLLSMAVLLSGCSRQSATMQSVHQFVQHAPKTAVSIPSLPKTPVRTPLAYQNLTHRDPFTSFSELQIRAEAKQKGAHPAPAQHGPTQSLGKYPLSSLRLIGMVRASNHLWAILEAPGHQVYRATLGSAVGTHDGRITAMRHQIAHSSITVTQYVRNVFRKYQPRVTILHLPTKDGP